MESRVAGCADHGVGGRLGTLVFARARSTCNGASEAPVMATQLDPATQLDDSASERRAATPSTVRGESPMSTPAKKQRLSGLEFSPAKENAYKVVPTPAQSSKSEPVRPGPPTSSKSEQLADEVLEVVLRERLGKREVRQPLSMTLRSAEGPDMVPPSMEDMQIGKKLTDMSQEVQARVLSLCCVFLQTSPPRQAGQRHIFLTGHFWNPIVERLIQGMMESYHSTKEPKRAQASTSRHSTWLARNNCLPMPIRLQQAAVDVPETLRDFPSYFSKPAEPKLLGKDGGVLRRPAATVRQPLCLGCKKCRTQTARLSLLKTPPSSSNNLGFVGLGK